MLLSRTSRRCGIIANSCCMLTRPANTTHQCSSTIKFGSCLLSTASQPDAKIPPKQPLLGVAVVILRSSPTFNQRRTTNSAASASSSRSSSGNPDDIISIAAIPSAQYDSAAYPISEANSNLDQEEDAIEVMLVKRANAPMKDYWGFPGGRLEFGESMEAAAEREVLEECSLRIRVDPEPLTVTEFIPIEKDDATAHGAPPTPSRPRGHYVLVFMRAIDIPLDLLTRQYQLARPGDDAADCRWFPVKRLARYIRAQGREMKDDPSSISTVMIIPDVLKVLEKDRRVNVK